MPQFIPSVHKSTKQVSFVWLVGMSCQMTYPLCHISSIFPEEAESLSLHKSLPTLGVIVFSDCLCGFNPLMFFSAVNSLDLFLFCCTVIRVCLLMEIKRYKSHIGIRNLYEKPFRTGTNKNWAGGCH